MWNHNFLFRAHDAIPLSQTESDVFHETDPALDSSGLQMETYISVWLQGEGEGNSPTSYAAIYVRTATLDPDKHVGFLQPLQGRTHQIKQLLTKEQKAFLKEWLHATNPSAWQNADDHFHNIFEA